MDCLWLGRGAWAELRGRALGNVYQPYEFYEVYLAPYTRTDFAACECAVACACTYIGAQARTLAHTLARMLRHTDARTYTSVFFAFLFACANAFACAFTYIGALGPWGLELAWGRTYTAYKLSEV